MRFGFLLIATLAAAVQGCGGTLTGPLDAQGDASSLDDAGTRDGQADGEAGWTACTAPSGDMICGAPGSPCANCTASDSCINQPPTTPGCFRCEEGVTASNDVTVCASAEVTADGRACPDGTIAVATPASNYDPPGYGYACVHFDVGLLYSNNGWQKAVRYADWGSFTKDLLPESSTCPQVSGIQLCGGPCGDCPQGYKCTGRSPLHAFSVCIPPEDGTYCGAGCARGDANWGCFAFAFPASPADQRVAENNYHCVPGDWCRAAEKSLPGGGNCYIPQGSGCGTCFP